MAEWNQFCVFVHAFSKSIAMLLQLLYIFIRNNRGVSEIMNFFQENVEIQILFLRVWDGLFFEMLGCR